MSMISEDVKTVIDCQYLKARQVEANELTTETIVVDTISTNLLTLVDPADATKTGTLEEIGNTLEITAPTVQINGNAVVTGTMTVQTGTYTGTVVINDVVPPTVHTLVFNHGLLEMYTVM